MMKRKDTNLSSDEMSESTAWFIILSFIGLVILGPFISIWAINTLFPAAAIPYSWPTWLAAAWLHLTIFSKKVN